MLRNKPMKKSTDRVFEVVIVILIFAIIFAVAERPYLQYKFLETHYSPKPGSSKQAVVQRMGTPTGVSKTVPVPAYKLNRDIIDSLNNLPVSYIMYWRRKPHTLERLLELKRQWYKTSVVAFDKNDKVIKGFWMHSYWPEQEI